MKRVVRRVWESNVRWLRLALIPPLVLGLVALAWAPAVVAQPSVVEKWVARYNGPGNDFDRVHALAVDASGNVYVTGYSFGSGTGPDYATIKYDSSGTELWVTRYNGPGNSIDIAQALAVDELGNVYVTGQSYNGTSTGYDYATIKYDSKGNELWVTRYNGPGNDTDDARALAVDELGNVYVTGISYGSGTGNDYATIKYDSKGNQLWLARHDGPTNRYNYAQALAVDASGNVYVTGNSKGSGTKDDYATIKYDTNGNQLWKARYNGPGNDFDVAYALAVDASGNVYVTGYSKGIGTRQDYTTIKYDSSGTELWAARYNGPVDDTDVAHALAVDASGNVYVTGESMGSGTGSDYATIKYDSEGNELWVARHDGPASRFDKARALAVDEWGNVYVTGNSGGTSTDYATIKYDTNGNQLWEARYNGPGDDLDYAWALAVDGSGNIYVTGFSKGSGTGYDYVTIKYSGNQPPVANAGDDQAVSPGETVTFDGSGSSDPDGTGTIVSYEWNFGDDATGSGETITHFYTSADTYTVSLTVTDDYGATDTDTAIVTVTAQTPAETPQDLISDVEDLNLPGGIENSLVSKLEGAIKSLDKGQENAAINKLNAFINQVEAQRGKKITDGQADELIAKAQGIIDNI